MAKNKLTIKVDADTQKALQQMKELTEAANECVAAFEKLEKKLNRFQKEPVEFERMYVDLLDRSSISCVEGYQK